MSTKWISGKAAANNPIYRTFIERDRAKFSANLSQFPWPLMDIDCKIWWNMIPQTSSSSSSSGSMSDPDLVCHDAAFLSLLWCSNHFHSIYSHPVAQTPCKCQSLFSSLAFHRCSDVKSMFLFTMFLLCFYCFFIIFSSFLLLINLMFFLVYLYHYESVLAHQSGAKYRGVEVLMLNFLDLILLKILSFHMNFSEICNADKLYYCFITFAPKQIEQTKGFFILLTDMHSDYIIIFMYYNI